MAREPAAVHSWRSAGERLPGAPVERPALGRPEPADAHKQAAAWGQKASDPMPDLERGPARQHSHGNPRRRTAADDAWAGELAGYAMGSRLGICFKIDLQALC